MNRRLKRLGAKLAVCGSLVGSIAIIALYQPHSEQNFVSATAVTSYDRYTTMLNKDDTSHMEMLEWRNDDPDLQKKISLHVTGADIGTAIEALAKTTGLNFDCLASPRQSRLTLQLSDMPVWQVMQVVADASGGSWKRSQGSFTLSVAPASRATLAPRPTAVPA